MTTNHQVRILVENRAEQLIVEGILRAEIEAGEVHVDQCWELSSLLRVADLSLLEHPERPIALIVNANGRTPSDIEEEVLGPIRRRLSDTASNDWIVVVAYPDILAWARSDARFDHACKMQNLTNKHDLAARFADWSKAESFDRASLSTSDSQFASLLEFLTAHAAAASS